MGVLWGTLFLEAEPLSLDMLAEKTGYSKTTVRSNISYLESFGIARRVVGPLGKQHRNKQHRYGLVTDIEALMPVIWMRQRPPSPHPAGSTCDGPVCSPFACKACRTESCTGSHGLFP